MTSAKHRPGWRGPITQAFMIVCGAVGGYATASLGIPAGWLSGAMFMTAALAATGWAVPLSATVRRTALAGTGIALGSAITPAMLRGFLEYPLTLALMSVSVAGATWTGTRILERVPGWTRATAFFAAVPGALSYVFIVASDTDAADLPRIAVVQVIRVFLLMGLVPIVVAETGTPLVVPPIGPIDSLPLLALMIALGASFGYALERVRLAAGMMFGTMIVTGLAHATGFAPGRPPPEFTRAAQILIGTWVGARFIGFDWALFGRSLAASLGSFVIAVLIAGVCAGIATAWLGIPFAQSLVAFAPGGLEAMSILSIALGLNPVFVSAHHLARFMLISVTLPFVVRRWIAPVRATAPAEPTS